MSEFLLALSLAGWLAAVPAAAAAAEGATLDGGETMGSAADTEEGESAATAVPPEERRTEEAPERTARGEYNAGLALLGAGDHEAAAEAFLHARDRAGPDPELRYRAAFNLGLALAAGAGEGTADEAGTSEVEAMQRAIESLRRSAAWFGDAVRLAPPGDDDARINLELVSRRILALADSLRGTDDLQARLDRLIDDQRGVRDRLRSLLADVEAEAAAAEPLGFRDAFDDLASRERMLMAEVGDGIDVAAEERLFIEQTPEADRSAEQRLRAWQLATLSAELERARQSLGETRRRLRRLEGERAHRRADAALADLKRARERLLDPVSVLGAVARDQTGLVAHATALAAAATVIADEASGPGKVVPRWLTSEHLAERQADVAARAGGVLDRFQATMEGADAPGGDGREPQAERTLRAAAEAAPALTRAVDAMQTAIAKLETGRTADAPAAQRDALAGIRQAIEAFAGVRQLVEIAHGDQKGIVSLLEAGDGEAPAAGARTETIHALAADNERRLHRLKQRLEDERADAVAAVAGNTANAGPGQKGAQERQHSIEERYRHAEVLRGRALDGLQELDEILADATHAGAGTGAEAGARARAQAAARDTLAALDELRRLFFSISEHVEALRADQSETRDRTATLQFERFADTDSLAAGLGVATERQRDHERLAATLAAALAEQADAAAGASTPGTNAADPDARERFATAAGEVREAGGRMRAAGARLAEAATRAASPMLEPVLEDQMAAIEHLENALRALSETDDGGERQQAGNGLQAAQGQTAEERPDDGDLLSRRQALKRLQAIRDREAERRRGREAPGREPVEKDW